MNLVIDDAVEVKQVTKTNPEEKRRQLGMCGLFCYSGTGLERND
jgi:small nuclear ribonucleoprotein (snRNP)-like protein